MADTARIHPPVFGRSWAALLQAAALAALAAALLWPAPFAGGAPVPWDLLEGALPWASLPGAGAPHNPLLSDALAQFYPWRTFDETAWRAGQWPLWDPYVLGGQPTFAAVNEQAFYPLNLLLAFLPTARALGWLAWLQLTIAGLGVRAFARLHLKDDPSACLAAVIFMLGAPVVVWLEYPVFLSTIAWTGWLLYLLDRLLRSGQPRWSGLAGLAIGLELLGGQTQYSIYLALLVVGYVGAWLLQRSWSGTVPRLMAAPIRSEGVPAYDQGRDEAATLPPPTLAVDGEGARGIRPPDRSGPARPYLTVESGRLSPLPAGDDGRFSPPPAGVGRGEGPFDPLPFTEGRKGGRPRSALELSEGPAGAAEPPQRGTSEVLRRLGLALVAAMIGGGLGAVAYLPALQFVPLAHRVPLSLDHFLALALPLANAVTLVLPNAFGTPLRGDFVGFFDYNETAAYLGLLPLLLLALVPVTRPRGRSAVALGLAGLVVLGLLFGWRPLATLFWLIPPNRYFGLNRLVVLLPITIGYLAAASYAALPAVGRARWGRTAAILVAGAALAGAIALAARAQAARPGPAPFATNDRSLALALAAASVLALLARLWLTRPGSLQTAAAWLAVGVLALDLLRFGRGYNTVVPANQLGGAPPAPLTALATGPFAPRSVGMPVEQLIFPPNLGLLWQIPTPDGYASEYLADYGDFVQHANAVQDELSGSRFASLHPGGNYVNFSQARAPYLDLLGVRDVVTSPGAELPDTFRLRSNGDSVRIAGPVTVGARFRARQNGLNRIDVFPDLNGRPPPPPWLALHLKANPQTMVHLAYVRLPGSAIRPGQPLTFWFKPIADSAGRSFYFYLDAPDATAANALQLRERLPPAGAPPGDALLIGDRPAAGALAFAADGAPFGDWPLVAQANHLAVYRNPGALPRAFVVHQVQVMSDAAFYAGLDDGSVNPGQVAAVAGPPPADLAEALSQPAPLAEAPEVVVADQATTSAVTLQVTLHQPGLLVVSNAWYPGWQATVDGVAEPVERVDAVFQGVYLPAGAHRIGLAFAPTSLRLGLLAGAAALALAVAAIAGRWR